MPIGGSRVPSGKQNFPQVFDLSTLRTPVSTVVPEVGIAITQGNLVAEILPASAARVVIVLCWSPRSVQSQEILTTLGKFNETDIGEDGEPTWVLGSVNVDAEPAVAKALQVQSVPLAIAIIQEQLVPLFESIPPPEQVRMVIDKVLSLAAERGVGKPAAAAEDVEETLEPEEIAAMEAMEQGDMVGAQLAYESWLKRSPGNSMAEIGLAQVELLLRIDGLNATDALLKAAAAPSDIALQIQCADLEVARGEYEQGFNRLITAIRNSDGEERKACREHLLSLFRLVDPSDPVLIKARQGLASALY